MHNTREQALKEHPERFKYKVYFKSHGCSMVMLDKLTLVEARHRVKILSSVFTGWRGRFVASI